MDTKPHWELYDLRQDPFEMNNLYGQKGAAKITAQLKKQLFATRKAIGDTDEQFPEVHDALKLAE